MELILISDSKLKIMLSESDLESYSLTSEILDYENSGTREAFKSILDEAKIKTGFDSDCGRLFIKVFPSKNGGCEVYVTKSGVDNQRTQTKKTQNAGAKKEYCVFSLDGIDRVCNACNSLVQTGYTGESSLYYESKNGRGCVYYLVLQQDSKGFSQQKKKRMPEKCDVVREFGNKLEDGTAYFYIKEHCEMIIGDKAAERLCGLV